MNISNDVSIGSRVAMLNNPFGTYASKMNGFKFAALDSDMRPSYVNEYTNVFGLMLLVVLTLSMEIVVQCMVLPWE